MKKCTLIYLAFLLFLVLSCSSSTEPEATFFDIQGETGFVGTVKGTNAFVSIMVGEVESIVYVCNGEEEISEWFKGSTDDPADISFTNSAGAQVSAQFSGASFSGEVTLRNSSKYSFTANPDTNKWAGVWRVMGEQATIDEIEAGWIVTSEGDVRGALISSFTFIQAPAVPQSAVVVNNTSYPVFHFSLTPSPGGPIPVPYPHPEPFPDPSPRPCKPWSCP